MSDKMNMTGMDNNTLFEKEFLPHADALYNFSFHLTYNEEDANDLVQDTFLKAFRFIDSYERGTNAKAWLFKILKNGFINEYRRKSRQPNEVDYEDFITYQESDTASLVGDMDLREELFKGLIGDEVTKAVNDLPVDFRTVILLSDVEGFTYEEIAKIVDIPIGTVRSRLHRARNLMKEKLRDYATKMGYKENR
ncbi:MAG: sigma-70 family RNA polymerase sigma factor [Chitinophagales bacterium]|nr:sigma-70 family RNA polymerase sigma factor [Chitinophagales bacterium]